MKGHLVNSFGIIALVRPEVLGNQVFAGRYDLASQRSYHMAFGKVDNNVSVTISKDGIAFFYSSVGTLPLSKWAVYAVSYQFVTDGASVLKGWINDELLLNVTNAPGPLKNSTAPFSLGACFNGGSIMNRYKGKLVHVAVTSESDIGAYIAQIARIVGVV